MSQDYRDFHLNLLKVAYNNLLAQPPFNQDDINSVDIEFIDQFKALVSSFEDVCVDMETGQRLLARIPHAYPELTPLMPRDLFWFFGGECLHFMPDDEIQAYQQLDEARFEAADAGQPFNYEDTRAKLLGLH
ncbi:MAG: PA2817 family protein [Pontibacterium sp.]